MILFFVVFPTGRNFWDSENGVEKREYVWAVMSTLSYLQVQVQHKVKIAPGCVVTIVGLLPEKNP